LGLPVLHLYVFDPRWYKKTPLCGFPRTGPIRARFQLQAIQDLSKRLQAHGHELCVKRGMSTASAFEALCRDFQIEKVLSSSEVCSEELRVEQQVRDVLQKHAACKLETCWTFELHHYEDLPMDLRQRGSNSYTGYKNIFHHTCHPRQPLPTPKFSASKCVSWDKADSIPNSEVELGVVKAPGLHPSAEIQWIGGETAALKRLHDYFFGTDALALDYVGSTNTPREGNSCTKEGAMSRLSPWLAHGCISARYLFAEIKRYERERHKSGSTYWLVHELYWRDFVRFESLRVGNRIFKIGGLYNKHPQWPWSKDIGLLEHWMHGTTGLPFLDAAMRETEATGYTCHVGRETSAWFLICDLGLDWRMGAEWFESVLIDYEPAANWFCWVFVCLIRATGGNGFREIGSPELRPCTRLQTVEIVFLSAQHDPDGTYIKRWVPELRCLPDGLPVREPWRSFDEPVMAVSSKSRAGAHAFSPGPDRIQMARRTLTKGGPSVAVWWNCSRNARQAPAGGKWPSDYPMPILPPASFYDIEKVAEKARSQQRQKKIRMDVLRKFLRGSGCVASDSSFVPDTIEECATDESEAAEGEQGAVPQNSKRQQLHDRFGHNRKSRKWTRENKKPDSCNSATNSYYGGNQTWAYQDNEWKERDSSHKGPDLSCKARRWGKPQRVVYISCEHTADVV
jgi:deoxyribodipyrimidine photo-lyase